MTLSTKALQGFCIQRDNLLAGQTPVPSGVRAPNAADVTLPEPPARAGQSTGRVVVEGTHQADADATVEVTIQAGDGTARRVAVDQHTAGNGTLTAATADSGTTIQRVRVKLSNLGTKTRRATATWAGVPIRATDAYSGDLGNDIYIETDSTAVIAALSAVSTVPEDVSADTVTLDGRGWDVGGARALDADGELAPDATGAFGAGGTERLTFDPSAKAVYRQYTEQQAGRRVIKITPPLVEPLSEGQRIYRVSPGAQYTVTATYDNGVDPPVVETYLGVTEFDILRQFLGSALIELAAPVKENRRPSGLAALDVALRTAGYIEHNGGEGTRAAQLGFDDAQVIDQPRNEIFTARAYAVSSSQDRNAGPGRERWVLESSVDGQLLATVGAGDTVNVDAAGAATVIDAGDPVAGTERVRFKLPVRYPDGYGTADRADVHLERIEYAARNGATDDDDGEQKPPISLDADNSILGATPRQQIIELVWERRPLTAAECPPVDITGNLDPACIGLDGDAPGLPGDAVTARTAAVQAQIDALIAAGERNQYRVDYSGGAERHNLYGWTNAGGGTKFGSITSTAGAYPSPANVISAIDGSSVLPAGSTKTLATGYAYFKYSGTGVTTAKTYATLAEATTASEGDSSSGPVFSYTRTATYDWGGGQTMVVSFTPVEIVNANAESELTWSGGCYYTIPRTTITLNTGAPSSRTFNLEEEAEAFRDQYIADGGSASIVTITTADGNDPTYAGAIRAARYMLALLPYAARVAAALTEWDSCWATMSDDIDDVLASTADGTDPTFYDAHQACYDSIRDLIGLNGSGGDDCYTDPGGLYQFTVNSPLGEYLPLFPNVVYNSMRPGFIKTNEFRITLIVLCPHLLKEGDRVFVNIANTPPSSVYQIGDELLLEVHGSQPQSLAQGVTGNDTLTWLIEQEDGAGRPAYPLDTATPQSYETEVGAGPAAGIDFLITPGSVAFELGDYFDLYINGGRVSWTVNGGAASTEIDIPSAAVAVDGTSWPGLQLRFIPGSAGTDFEAGDVFRFGVEQPGASAQALLPNDTRGWQPPDAVAAASITVPLTGGAQPLQFAALFLHSIPVGRSVTIDFLEPDNNVAFTVTKTVTLFAVVAMAADPVDNIDRVRFAVDDGSGDATALHWLFAGEPIMLSRRAARYLPSRRRIEADVEGINQTPLQLGDGYDAELEYFGAANSDDSRGYLSATDRATLEAMAASVATGGEAIGFVPNVRKAAGFAALLRQKALAFEGDEFNYEPDDDARLLIRTALALAPYYR